MEMEENTMIKVKKKFEGEYLNGQKWNGKGFNINGNIEFEIKNGQGYIKEYNKYGKLKFEGEYSNGQRSGKGKEYYYFDDQILLFEGEYLNGERNGKGKNYYYYGNKLLFDGEYLNGKKWNGKGYNINGIQEYEIKNGKCNNIKEYNLYGELKYEGEYLNGKKNGK